MEIQIQTSNNPIDHEFLRALARNLIADSERAHEWLNGVPLPDDMMEVSDEILELHCIADDPATFLEHNGPALAAYAILAYAGAVRRLNAAYKAATKRAA